MPSQKPRALLRCPKCEKAAGIVEYKLPFGATFSCTGLVSEDEFLGMLRRAAFYAGRKVQVLKISGAGPDHPFLADVQESRYLKAVFCRVLD